MFLSQSSTQIHLPSFKMKVSFGSGVDRQTYPSEVPPNRLCNEYLPPNLVQDPKLGPGKYEVEELTKMIHNFSPNVYSSVGYIVGARHAPRFLPPDERSRFPAPNEYFKSRTSSSKEMARRKSSNAPFNAKSNRFKERKIEQLPTIGSYIVTEDFGRHVQ